MEDKKPILKILRKPFMEWYFQDKDDFKTIHEDMYNTLIKGGTYEISLESIWSNLGYIEMRMIANPEIVSSDDIKDNEIAEPSSSYDVEFISEK